MPNNMVSLQHAVSRETEHLASSRHSLPTLSTYCLRPRISLLSCRIKQLPAVKTKNQTSLQLFCGCGLSFIPAKQKAAVIWLITCVFLLQSTIRELATIRNRKKVAVLTDFLFFGVQGEWFGRRFWAERPGATPWSLLTTAPWVGSPIQLFESD